jgi:predicted dehydrogenase
MKNKNSRRSFLKKATLSSAVLASAPTVLGAKTRIEYVKIEKTYPKKTYSANDQVNLATIGFGIQGIGDTSTAVKVDGVKFVAACDLYDGRLERAKELYGKDIFTTRDYREILNRKDIDAVIIAVPDHWHEEIAIDSLKAGKAVYLEKPMIQKIVDGHRLIAVEKETGGILQVGSQGMSSVGNAKAREMFLEGAIGDLVLVEINTDRYSSEGAWQYPIPPDASSKTIDFDTFLGRAPKKPFDPIRFFRWRNYQDYGTGMAGDLFVHSFSTLHFVINSLGPERALSTGGLRFWKDGRDVPDITVSLYDFPATDAHPAFNAALRTNFIAGSGGQGGSRIVGTEGDLQVGQSRVTLRRRKLGMKPSQYALKAYTEKIQESIIEEYDKKVKDPEPHPKFDFGETVFRAPDDYPGGHYDHFMNFFEAIRNNKPVVENATYGLRAAGAALLANMSYDTGRPVKWDPVRMKVK